MNVLVINGSPKTENSNSMKLTRSFLNGAGYDAEIMHVYQLEIKPCLGCYACWKKTPGQCVIKDDMAKILDKIIAADVIIWSFPLYYFSLPGALKNLIDRQLPLNLPFMSDRNAGGSHPPRYDLSRKRYVLISTCGFWKSEGNYDGVTTMFDHIYGEGNYSKIFCGQGELFRVPELKARTDAYLDIVLRAGAEFSKGEIAPDTQKKLSEPLYAREVFERMADASWHVPDDETQPTDNSFNFITQMAALYRPDGKERVLEFHFTDVDKTYQLLLTPRGSSVIKDNFKPYTTRIETPYKLWQSIARGEISGPDALFQKKYRVLGDFELMLHWGELFGGASSSLLKNAHEKDLKTNMSVLLAPWIVTWIALAINPTIGGVLGIITAAIVPLLWLAFKPTIFERISVLAIAGLCIFAIFGVDMHIVVPLSYGMFGLIWFITLFCSVPLTAHYSQNNYGGSKALENPLFIRTNRILTACWGILYLLAPFWTYVLMTTTAAPFVGLINSVAPAVMGGFTIWFQKWYPATWAKG